MKRHPILIPISREHHQVLLLAQLLKKDAPPYRGLPVDRPGKIDYAAKRYHELLASHLRRDTDKLYPYLLHWPALEELLSELNKKAERIRQSFDELDQSFSIEQMDSLGHLLENYVRVKERVLFQSVQQSLSEAEMLALAKELSNG